MNRYITYLFLILTIVSCNEVALPLVDPLNADAVELKGAEAYIAGGVSTRAAALDAYNYVGRNVFENGDEMVLTTIKRTDQPIPGFSYSGIVYDQVIEEGQTSGGWNRDNTKGRTEASEQVPERIYWSDSHNGHTYIGYSVPQQPDGGKAFDWEVKSATYGGAGTEGIPVYYGSLGDPTTSGYIDYTNNKGEEPEYDNPQDPEHSAQSYKTGNDKIKCDDILLTWDDNKVAETGGSVAKLYFHHGLAQVRVIVNIQGFSASSTAADSWSVVSDMILKDMLTLYRWRQQSYKAEALDLTYDDSNITSIYGEGVTCDQKKDVHLWIPRPEGTGSGVGKQFTFYGLAVPTTMAANALNLEFTVHYQDPMDPWKDAGHTTPNMKDHTYKATMTSAIEFRAGHCTTINITLNHNNEQMTVGAEYMDWQLVETPDQGELQKNATFLTNTQRSSVTIMGDAQATADDATWLYIDSDGKVRDIYGHTGSEDDPFQISTAKQLLSFAYEVKGTNRVEKTYKDLKGQSQTLSGGFDFTGYTVSLDASLTLQTSTVKTKRELELQNPDIDKTGSEYTQAPTESQMIQWIGIGESGKPFNGTFLGGVRLISRLYGNPFFAELGQQARVEQLILESVIDITGNGGFASVNRGTICASTVDGNVTSESTEPVGSFAGTNEGLIFACYHVGDITAPHASAVGGLVGTNERSAKIVASYNYGKITGTTGNVYGVLGNGSTGAEGSVVGCFYDSTRAPGISVAPEASISSDYTSSGKPTDDIIKASFAGIKESTSKDCLNGIINTWADANKKLIESYGQTVEHFKSHYYVSQPASYPYVY